jgi:hypothetical protein
VVEIAPGDVAGIKNTILEDATKYFKRPEFYLNVIPACNQLEARLVKGTVWKYGQTLGKVMLKVVGNFLSVSKIDSYVTNGIVMAEALVYDKINWSLNVCEEKGTVKPCINSFNLDAGKGPIFAGDSVNFSGVILDKNGVNINDQYHFTVISQTGKNKPELMIKDNKISFLASDSGQFGIIAFVGDQFDTIQYSVLDNHKIGYCEDGKTVKYIVKINKDSLYDGLYEYYNCKSKVLESMSYYKQGVLNGPITFYAVDTRQFSGKLGTDSLIDYSNLFRYKFIANAINGYLEGTIAPINGSGSFIAENGNLLRSTDGSNWCGPGGDPKYRGTAKFENGVFSYRLEYASCENGKSTMVSVIDNNYWIQSSTQYCSSGAEMSYYKYDYLNNTKALTQNVCL